MVYSFVSDKFKIYFDILFLNVLDIVIAYMYMTLCGIRCFPFDKCSIFEQDLGQIMTK